MRGHVWALFALALAAPANAGAQEWEEISDEDGIKVWSREVPGTSLVEFRGRGVVEAPMKVITAVLRDQKRKTEWMQNCIGNAALQYYSGQHLVVYNRTESPAFFINDRDVVLDVKASFNIKEKWLRLDFKNTEHAKMPAVDGVVRMPNLKGYWHMVHKGPKSTEVTYQVQADPGGAIPKWIVNWASKGLPFNTLRRLRDQVKKPGYDQELMIVEASFDWSVLDGTEPVPATQTATAAKTLGAR